MSILVDMKCGDPVAAAARYQTAGYMLAYNAGAGDLIEFDPAGHIYRRRIDGSIVPGVTTVLKDTGVSADFDGLSSMGKRIEHAIQLKRDIGTAVHADAHAYDDNDLDIATVHPEVRPYLDCWIAFRGNYPHLRPATRERLVYHPVLGYAGTLDAIFLQAGESDIEITERWSVQLCPGRKVPYRVTAYEDHYGDAETFKAIVATFHVQHGRRAAA